jgi:hypothetical protein
MAELESVTINGEGAQGVVIKRINLISSNPQRVSSLCPRCGLRCTPSYPGRMTPTSQVSEDYIKDHALCLKE